MRTILVLLVILLAFGAMTQTAKLVGVGNDGIGIMVASAQTSDQGDGANGKVNTNVDRNDDPEQLLPCTDAANDCSLRSAIAIANNDGVPTTITFADHFIITLSKPLPMLTEDQTSIRARAGQEVHIDGNGTAGSIFYITGKGMTIEGLRLYGSGKGYAIIAVTDNADQALITNNLIGDDDFPAGNCGQSNLSFGGIYINSKSEASAIPAWIVGNIIECLSGAPGVGITIAADNVVIGRDSQGRSNLEQRNTIRWNQGHAIQMGDNIGNTICNTLIHDNGAGALHVTNFNNNIMDNDIR